MNSCWAIELSTILFILRCRFSLNGTFPTKPLYNKTQWHFGQVTGITLTCEEMALFFRTIWLSTSDRRYPEKHSRSILKYSFFLNHLLASYIIYEFQLMSSFREPFFNNIITAARITPSTPKSTLNILATCTFYPRPPLLLLMLYIFVAF